MRGYISLDVGGTEIKSAVVSYDHAFLTKRTVGPSHSKESAEKIIDNLVMIINTEINKAKEACIDIAGIGIAFPGPSDYERGISLMRGIGKYDSIYGLSITKLIQEKLYVNNADIRYGNDAGLFCLGESAFGAGVGYNRCMLVCIGTGLGSGFVENGKLITGSEDLPEHGWLYNEPYRDGIIDSYISATGIRRMIKNTGLLTAGTDVKALSELSRAGNKAAAAIFKEFGHMMTEALVPFAASFNADCLIIGGQVAKSADLFTDEIKAELCNKGIAMRIAEDSAGSAMRAVPLLFR